MVNPDGLEPTIMPLRSQNQREAILCKEDYGPTFGRAHDLHISDNANININSHYVGDDTYNFPRAYRTFFTGDSRFFVTNYEVFLLLH